MNFTVLPRLFVPSIFVLIFSTNVQAAPIHGNTADEMSEARRIFEQAKAYHDGQGVPRNLSQACSLYASAAELGNVNAKVNLGYMLFLGEGCEQNYFEARAWYSQAADAGDADAISTLLMMDRLNLGVPTANVTEIFVSKLPVQEASLRSNDVRNFRSDSSNIESSAIVVEFGAPDALPRDIDTKIVEIEKINSAISEGSVYGTELSQVISPEDFNVPLSADAATSTAFSNSQTLSVLENLILNAYSHHPALKSLREQTNASKEGIVEARGSYFPQVNLNASIFQTDREGQLQTGLDFDQNTTPKSISLNLTQGLYDGGRRKLAKQNAVYLADASQAQFMDSATQIAAEIIQDYMSLSLAQKQVNVLTQTVTTLENLEAIVTARREIGDAVSTDVSLARSELIGAHARIASAEADIANMTAVLQSKTGQFVGVALLPDEATRTITRTVEDMKQMARDGSAALAASEFTMLSREVNFKSEKRKNRPTISLEANASSRRDATPTIDNDEDINIGVRLSLPIYTGGIGASQTRQALSLYNAARFDYENVSRLVDLQVNQYWSQLKSSRTLIEARRASVTANAERLIGATEGQKAGISSSQDVLDAARDRLSSDLELASAEHQQYTLRLLLRLLIGELDVNDFE